MKRKKHFGSTEISIRKFPEKEIAIEDPGYYWDDKKKCIVITKAGTYLIGDMPVEVKK